MQVTRGILALTVVVCLGVPAGCKEDKGGAPATGRPDPATGPASAAAPGAAAVDVPALLRAGGTNWSSVPEGESAPGVPAPGGDYWVWPADDAVLVPARGANAELSVRLNWRLRPGGKPVGEKLYGTITSARPGAAAFTLRAVAGRYDGGAEAGVAEFRFAPWKPTAGGDVTL